MKLGPVVAELLAALIVVGMFLTSVIFWFVGDFSGTIANTPKIVLSDATKTSDSPQIAVGYGNNTYQGNGVFAVWREHPNGSHNFSIYFRKGEEATK